MAEEFAKQLIKDTLQSPFDKDRFAKFIKHFLKKIDEEKAVHFKGYVKECFRDIVRTYERIGTFSDSNGNKIDILIVYLNKDTSIDKARTAQRNFIAKYLKDRGEKEAALVAFVTPDLGNWRFSFVKMEYKFAEATNEKIKIKEDFTPAKRYSFLVGNNESSHTAQRQLFDILSSDEMPTINEIEKSFSVEKVTIEFFEKYRDLYLKLKESLDEIKEKDKKIKKDFLDKNIDTVNFSKKLLGQIVFLYFLQKKGWFGVHQGNDWGTGPKNFLRLLYEKRIINYNNFFNDVLEPLFYKALAMKRKDDYFSLLKCKIPFLNGGLFDPINNYDWQNTDILLPNELFSNNKKNIAEMGILDVFDMYNFTVKEDEPLEKEVAIDPEMLGKVFENLLEVRDRKSTGTYYTPREIVHFMCQQSLMNYLTHELENKIENKDLETLVRYGEMIVEHESRVHDFGKETDKYPYLLPESIRQNVELIDNKLASITICDPAVGSGAFPVGVMNEIVRIRNVLSSYIKDKSDRTLYDFKRHAIEVSIYGVDNDPSAVEIAKLRLWLSLIVDEENIKGIKPLPNLDYKIVCGNSLFGCKINSLFSYQIIQTIERLKPLYFNETDSEIKEKYRKQINGLMKEVSSNKDIFDFELYFSEVFHNKRGFDLVIANPPYVKEYTDKSLFENLKNSEYYQGKMDIWYFFGSIGLDILHENGIECFIAPNNWVSNAGASKFRKKILEEGQLLQYVDFGNYKVFETAGIQTMVYLLTKSRVNSTYKMIHKKMLNDKVPKEDLDTFLNSTNSKDDFIVQDFKFDRSNFKNGFITFLDKKTTSIVEKIISKDVIYLNESEVANGIHPHHASVTKKMLDLLGNGYTVGEGIFLLDEQEKDKLNLKSDELELLKPAFTSKELYKYFSNPNNQYWIIYTDSKFKDRNLMNSKPNIKQHLDRFQKVITSDNKPYGLHRCRFEAFFTGKKIMSLRKCIEPTFTYTDHNCYVLAEYYVIKTNRVKLKYLTGLLNSKLIAYWLFNKGKRQGNIFQIDKEPLLNVPIKLISGEEQEVVAALIDKLSNNAKKNHYSPSYLLSKEYKNYESKINELIYKSYNLSKQDIQEVEDFYTTHIQPVCKSYAYA